MPVCCSAVNAAAEVMGNEVSGAGQLEEGLNVVERSEQQRRVAATAPVERLQTREALEAEEQAQVRGQAAVQTEEAPQEAAQEATESYCRARWAGDRATEERAATTDKRARVEAGEPSNEVAEQERSTPEERQ
jgi:hypothetical protein